MKPIGNGRNGWTVSQTSADLRRPFAEARPVTIDAAPQRVTMDLQRTAILVIDMQNDFCSEGGWLDHIGADYKTLQSPVEPLNKLLPVLRSAKVPVVWVNWGNRPDRSNLSPSVLHVYNMDGESTGIGKPLPGSGSKVLEKDSWSAAIIDDLKPEPQDIRVDKYRMSGFWDTPLDSILRNLRVDTLLFTGVNLDQCVMATLQDAVNLGYDAILLQDCSVTNSPSFCTEATLYNVKQCYGFVAHSGQLIQNIQTSL
ncbi:cysteine hydrolase family protein [Paenibacillus sp. y28]|uniref:cysteine hydrolase family protein n=1 Tax=Paenibacillus sp. y28 TaxID=3129110 RepID=UPI00301B4170